MLYVTPEGHRYKIGFSKVHRLEIVESKANEGIIKEVDLIDTQCEITRVGDRSETSQTEVGYAFLSLKDYNKYNKVTGKKIAFEEAMYKFGYFRTSKENRRLIWNFILPRLVTRSS